MKGFLLMTGLLSLSLVVSGITQTADKMTERPLKSPLKFKEDGTFKILTFGDVHWDKFNDKDKKTLAAMDAVLEAEQPDLVIYTGDNCLSDKVADVKKGYIQLTEPVVRRGIPWAATLGNHDAEYGGIARKDVYCSMLGLPGNLSRLGPKQIHGYGNYILPVMSHSGRKPAALFYILDSNAYNSNTTIKGYDWIRHNQIQWYQDASNYYKKYNKGVSLPSYAFFHIPPQEFNLFYSKGTVVGVKQEDVCASLINSGIMAAFMEQGDVKAVFCGHDHINDYIAGLGGMWVGYTRGISYNTYGKEGYLKGSRVIVLKEGTPSFDTWLRLEDKSTTNKLHCK